MSRLGRCLSTAPTAPESPERASRSGWIRPKFLPTAVQGVHLGSDRRTNPVCWVHAKRLGQNRHFSRVLASLLLRDDPPLRAQTPTGVHGKRKNTLLVYHRAVTRVFQETLDRVSPSTWRDACAEWARRPSGQRRDARLDPRPEPRVGLKSRDGSTACGSRGFRSRRFPEATGGLLTNRG